MFSSSERVSRSSLLLLDAPVFSIFGSLRCICNWTIVSYYFSTPPVVLRIAADFAPLAVALCCCYSKCLCLAPFLPSLFRIAAFLVDSPPACYLSWASFRRRMLEEVLRLFVLLMELLPKRSPREYRSIMVSCLPSYAIVVVMVSLVSLSGP